MYYLYVLLSKAKKKTYTGIAKDVKARLKEHNAGRVKSSRPYMPYEIIHTEPFNIYHEARMKEDFYKSSSGRRKLKKLLA